MKKCLFFIFMIIFATSVWAQTPQNIPYQAVARNSTGNLLVNQQVRLRFTIRETSGTGTIDYQETQLVTTNNLGLFSVNIGSGTVASGNFSGVPWSNGVAKYTQVEIDPTGGTTYTNMGAAQMMSVPYALYAGNASSVTSSNLTESTSDVLTITGGSNSVVSAAGTSIQVKKATASQDGYLSSGDWTTFNNKQAALTFNPPLSNTSNAVSFAAQSANTVFAGPTTGSAASPTFRALVAADLPAGNGSYIQNQTSTPQAAGFEISGTGYFTNVSTGTSIAGDLQLGCAGSNCWTANNANGIIGFVGYGKAHGELAFYPDYSAFALLSSSCCTPSADMGALSTSLAFDNLWAGSGYFLGNSGIGTASPSGLLELKKTTQLQSNLVLSGQEYYQASNTSTGIALMIGVSRSGNKQLWIADEDNVATQNSTNSVIRLMPNGTTPVIDAIATNGSTSLNLQVGTANVGIGGSPSQKLDVYGNAGLRGTLLYENTPSLCPVNSGSHTLTSAEVANGVYYVQNNSFATAILPTSSAGQSQGQIMTIYNAASSGLTVQFPCVNENCSGATGGSIGIGSGAGGQFMWTNYTNNSNAGGWVPLW